MPAVPGQPGRSGRLARALALDSNPLRRTSDRAETWIRVVLIVVFLIAGPMAAQAAAGWAHRTGTAGTSAAAAHVHAVRAVLLQPAPVPVALHVPDGDGQVRVRAQWEIPGAPARTGEVLAPRGSAAGTVVTVWLTASGQVTGPPGLGHSSDDTVLAAPAMLVVVALMLLAVLRLIQRFLNAKRLADWEAAWSAVAPRWTGHRP